MPEPNYQLQAARAQRMWTQDEAAAKVGVDTQTFWRWENGEQKPRAYSLRKLCEVFGLSAEELGFGRSSKDVDHAQRIEEALPEGKIWPSSSTHASSLYVPSMNGVLVPS